MTLKKTPQRRQAEKKRGKVVDAGVEVKVEEGKNGRGGLKREHWRIEMHLPRPGLEGGDQVACCWRDTLRGGCYCNIKR